MAEVNKEKSKGAKGLFKGMGGMGGWFSALMGKPRTYVPPDIPEEESPSQSTPETPKTQSLPKVSRPSPEEDSISADIQGFKKLVGKSFQKVTAKTTPVAEQGAQIGTQAVVGVKELVDKSFLKKLVKVFFILVFILILVFIAIRLFRILEDENGEVVRPPGISATPPPYESYQPSVYAQDPEVLQLEEDINILEAELANTNIREERLFPPSLDYNVNF